MAARPVQVSRSQQTQGLPPLSQAPPQGTREAAQGGTVIRTTDPSPPPQRRPVPPDQITWIENFLNELEGEGFFDETLARDIQTILER